MIATLKMYDATTKTTFMKRVEAESILSLKHFVQSMNRQSSRFVIISTHISY